MADHTAILAATLQQRFDVTVVTSTGARVHSPAAVMAEVEDWRSPVDLVVALSRFPARTHFIWQYVPHAYGRGGVNGVLPRVMAAFQGRGGRQVVIAHEIQAGVSWWPQRWYYRWSQRRQWGQVVRIADHIGVSTEAWLEGCRLGAPGREGMFELLASPATIPVANVLPGHRGLWREAAALPRDCKLLVGFGVSGGRAHGEWLRRAHAAAAAASDVPVGLVLIGDGASGVVEGASGESLVRSLGRIEARLVSQALQAADLLVLPFEDGVSERRTSFMAGLSHGCAVVTTVGVSTGQTLRQGGFFAAADSGDCAGFERAVADLVRDDERRRLLMVRGREVYGERYAWRHVEDRLKGWLLADRAA